MREPDSLDEQALMEDREGWHGPPGPAPHLHMWPERKILGDPPEYQHPENDGVWEDDEWEVYEEYERNTDEQFPS